MSMSDLNAEIHEVDRRFGDEDVAALFCNYTFMSPIVLRLTFSLAT